MTQPAKLLLIDAQNDFCDTPENLRPVVGEAVVDGRRVPLREAPALAVAGAHADMLRMAAFIANAGPRLDHIVATLDAHPSVAIERTTFWRGADGRDVAPFTEITARSVLDGTHTPAGPDRIDPVSGQRLRDRVLELLGRLEQAGRFRLMAWPVHCVTATWGAALHPAIAQALNGWERASLTPVHKVHKGQYALAEHYGVFEAETPLAEVASTCFNHALADELRCALLFVGGEASSHCVATSYDQLVAHRGTGAGIVLLSDCMSPVAGFEAAHAAFFDRARAAGSLLMPAAQALELLRAG
ncbi:cysteine hydrolase [Pseudorhodoferax sp.]|uniref:cysteine hydrolase n=1 Tax=Pseudorhodoferax sp. TaxID=1993553 RepID=UPI002DD67A57|nr:cysteine hydrolase [Pseudorhodoferax sp.]